MNTLDDTISAPVKRQHPRQKPRVVRYLLGAGVIFAGIAAYGIVDRNKSDAKLAQWTNAQAIPSVNLPLRLTTTVRVYPDFVSVGGLDLLHKLNS